MRNNNPTSTFFLSLIAQSETNNETLTSRSHFGDWLPYFWNDDFQAQNQAWFCLLYALRHRNISSIFRTELDAILHCPQAIAISPEPPYLWTTSFARIHHPLTSSSHTHLTLSIRRILLRLHSLSAIPKNITIISISSLMGIRGNERVDLSLIHISEPTRPY